MEMNKENIPVIVLIALGACMLLSKLGIHLDSWFGYLFALSLIAFGYYGVKAGNSFGGWIFIIFGAILLTGQLSGSIGILAAVAMIGFGVLGLGGNRSKGRRD